MGDKLINTHKIGKTLLNFPDIFFAIVGLILGIIITSLYLMSSTIYLLAVGLPLFFGCSVYIYYTSKQCKIYLCEYGNNTRKINNIFFVLFFTSSLYVLSIHEIRPVLYFIVISLCGMSLAISILSAGGKNDILIEISKIILLALNLIYSIYYSYSYISRSDYFIHAKMNNLLALTGNTNVLYDKEVYFPLMHIEVAISSILLDVGIKDATNVAIILPFVLSLICIYLIGRSYFDAKTGLFAMLLLSITEYTILWGSKPQTTSYGIIIFFYILFVLHKCFHCGAIDNKKLNSYKWIFILLVFIATMILTHAVSSFVLLISLLSLFVGLTVYRYLYGNETLYSLRNLTILTGVGLLSHWMIAIYRKDGRSFFDQIVIFLQNSVSRHSGILNRPESVPEYVAMLPHFHERFLNVFGMSILLFFAIIGGLYWISHKYRNQILFSFVFCTVLLLGFTFVFPFMGIRNIIPDRWFLFEYSFLTLMAAFAIVKFTNYIQTQAKKIAFLAILFFSFSLLMSSSTISNTDNPLWLKDSTPAISFTKAEESGMNTLSKFSMKLISDYEYGHTFLELGQNYQNGVILYEDQIDSLNDNVFVWRTYTLTRPVRVIRNLSTNYTNINYVKLQYSSGIYGYDFLNKLETNSKMYDNGEVSAYILFNNSPI